MDNKAVLIALVGASVCLGARAADERSVELVTQDDRISYSVGHEVGMDLRRQQLELRREALLRGILDAASDAKPLMTREDIERVQAEFRRGQLATRAAQAEALAAKGLDEGTLFLAENARKEGVTVLPNGLQYRIFQPGIGERPKATDMVTLRYRARTVQGAEFDNSDDTGGPVRVRLRELRMPGWREGLQLMREGAHWELVVPPELGIQDRNPLKNRVVILDLELLKVEDADGDPPAR
jgi:FKBP-type peptidyl-prolyl cis-trans isomerase FklB